MKTITGLIMIFNEKDFIQMWMKNVENLVDRVIIMDGGSTDETIQIINKVLRQRYKIPVELYTDYQDGEDYNDPRYNHQERRNKLIRLAEGKGDYIFQMDVDESIDDSDPDILRRLIESGKTVYTFPRYDFCFHPRYYRERTRNRVAWLYKNNIGIHYSNENPPHEPLVLADGLHLLKCEDRIDTDHLIFHWHYCFGRKAMKDYGVENWPEFLNRRKYVIEHQQEEELTKWTGTIPGAYLKYCEPADTIQAITMVFNEVEFMEMWLENISSMVDSILIMDGGSTDGTVEAIEKFKKRALIPVEYFIDKQEGTDYNDKRFDHGGRWNNLISKATGNYILQIMVDICFLEDPNLLRGLVALQKDVYVFRCYDFIYSPKVYVGYATARVPRLYRNGLGIKYSTDHAPHEPLVLGEKNLLDVKNRLDTDIPIFHYHYCWGRKAIRDLKLKSWDELLEKRKEIEGKVDGHTYKLWTGKFPEAYQKYCEAIK
jgi:glycosyltransferase involved in cell wall biosynthesis